jgi:hypothetical protein
MPLHRQVHIDVEGGSFEVDEGLAPLIRALWPQVYLHVEDSKLRDAIRTAFDAPDDADQDDEMATTVRAIVRDELAKMTSRG